MGFMQVILLEQINRLGKKGDVVNVTRGYGRNFLLPRKLAELANKGNLKTLEQRKILDQKEEEKQIAMAKRISSKLSESDITVGLKMGKDGKSFGSVTSADVCKSIEEQFGISLDKKKVVKTTESIRNLGTYQMEIRLHPKHVAKINVKIVSDDIN